MCANITAENPVLLIHVFILRQMIEAGSYSENKKKASEVELRTSFRVFFSC